MDVAVIRPSFSIAVVVVVLVMLVLFSLMIIAVVDILTSKFKEESQKPLWLLAVLFTGGVVGLYHLVTRSQRILIK